MRCFLLVACLFFAVVRSSVGQEAVLPPVSVPQWVVLSSAPDDQIAVEYPNKDANLVATYTVNVPYQEVGADGKVEQKFRVETRERKLNPEQLKPKTTRFRSKDVELFDLTGKKLDYKKDVAPRLAKPIYAVAISDSKIDPFFAAVLKSDTLFVVTPKKP